MMLAMLSLLLNLEANRIAQPVVDVSPIWCGASTVLCPLLLVQFAVVFKSRNNGDMKRDDIIKVVADVANAGGITHKVDLSNPELVICVEIIKVRVDIAGYMFVFSFL